MFMTLKSIIGSCGSSMYVILSFNEESATPHAGAALSDI